MSAEASVACASGAAVGVAASLAWLAGVNTSYSHAKSRVRTASLPEVTDLDMHHESLQTAKRQHVVFLLGPPFTNRRTIAKRLTNNRHLAKARGGPVVIEFDDCINAALRAKICRNERLSRTEVDTMLDDAVAHIAAAAAERPVIFSAVLPTSSWRKRILLAFDERTVISLTATADQLITRLDDTPSRAPTPPVEQNDQANQTNSLLSLEGIAAVQHMADSSLRSSQPFLEMEEVVRETLTNSADADDAKHSTKLEASVRWLHEVSDDIDVSHVEVDAGRTLHEVAKEVRLIVCRSMVRCSDRHERVTKDVEEKPIRRVGGARTVFGICTAGAVVGAAVGFVAFKLTRD